MIRYNPRGLSPNEVAESRRQHGDNVITPPKDDSVWKLLADKFRDPIIRILLLAAVLSLAIGFVHKDFTESIGIICAIILATCVGFWFEWDAMRRFRRLNQVNDDIPVKVMRDGAMHEVPRRDVVVGDVVYIESGETVPVDGELVEAVSLRINESTLTGELEVDKTVDEAHFDPDATYPSNVVLRGTTVADGYGVMVSTAVGDATEAGRVTEQATVQSEEQTPLNRQLTRLSKLIGRAGIVLSIAIFCVMLGKAIFINGLLEGDWLAISQHVLQIFMVSVAIIVMAVPEGLPMSITLSLAMSMRRMLKTNNLVRRMHACETMGAVTVICTDKTGTLTQNRMHVQELVRYDALPMHDFAEIVAANSTAFLDVSGAVIGNPTEGALLEWLHAQGEDTESYLQQMPIPYLDSRREDRRPADLLHRAQVYGDDYSERYFGPPDRLREGCARNRACDVCAGRERRTGGGTAARVPGAGDAYAGRGMGRDGRGRLPAGCRRGAASFCGCGGYFRPRARGCPRSRRALPEGGDRRQDRHGRHPGYGA